jgi:hypothetical protein
MPSDSPNYPLDASLRYNLAQYQTAYPNNWHGDPARGFHGAIQNPLTGDLTVEANFRLTRMVGNNVFKALAYLDLLDRRIEALQAATLTMEQTLDTLNGRLAELATLTASVNSLVGFMGVVIPGWQTKREVEQGDDMGLRVPSASELELSVEFRIAQAEPGFAHEQVMSIFPPPGTLVKRGSTVVVEINLTG